MNNTKQYINIAAIAAAFTGSNHSLFPFISLISLSIFAILVRQDHLDSHRKPKKKKKKFISSFKFKTFRVFYLFLERERKKSIANIYMKSKNYEENN
jgi:hypothetical protein